MTEAKIKSRNLLLKRFFENCFPEDKITIIGNINHPVVILNDHTCLSCFVHNYILNFTDHPFEGEVLFNVKLTQSLKIDERSKRMIADWFSESVHRESFLVGIKGTTLRLAGYNYIDRDNTKKSNRYPVFSERGCKIYLREENAQGAIERSSNKNLNLEVIRKPSISKRIREPECLSV